MAIDRLPENNTVLNDFEDRIIKENNSKKKRLKSFMNNAGIFVGAFIVFCVIVITSTDIRLATLAELSELGVSFFLLLFCTYSMHVACSDSGTRAGLSSSAYSEAICKYDEKKRTLIGRDMQAHLHDFCIDYVARELKNTRMRYLAVVGFTYEQYVEKWMNMDEELVLASDLSKSQKKAIIKANQTKPIVLTPEMIVRKISGEGRRTPMGINPKTKKKVHFTSKLFSTLVVTSGIVMIVVDVTKDPTWAGFATVVLKSMSVILNGFTGYKFGFENIAIDTVEYISDQTDLIEEAIRFVENANNMGERLCKSTTSEFVSATSPRESAESSLTQQTLPTNSAPSSTN